MDPNIRQVAIDDSKKINHKSIIGEIMTIKDLNTDIYLIKFLSESSKKEIIALDPKY